MNTLILMLVILAICIPLALTFACLQVILQISRTLTCGDIKIKLSLEMPPPIEYTAVPEQPEDTAGKKIIDAAQAIQSFFLDEDQMFKDKEVT